MFEPTQRYTAVIADIDAANADDPRTIVVEGVTRPYEVVYSERMTRAAGGDVSRGVRIAAHRRARPARPPLRHPARAIPARPRRL